MSACTTLPAPPDDARPCSGCSAPVTDGHWRCLFYVGLQDDGAGGWLELRNHGCGSTLARQVMCGRCGARASWLEAGGIWSCECCSRAAGLR